MVGLPSEHLADVVKLGVGETKGTVQGFWRATHPTKLPARNGPDAEPTTRAAALAAPLDFKAE